MSHIVIDARKYFDYGIGTYIQELIAQLCVQDHENRYSLVVSDGEADKSVGPAKWSQSAVGYGKYSLSELLFLGRHALRGLKGDLFHIPHYTLPFFCEGKSVVTVHDVIQLKFPQYFNSVKRAYAYGVIGHAVRNAGAVIAVSETTKNDLIEMFKVPETRIHVVHNGVSSAFSVEADSDRRKNFLRSCDLAQPYLLYVGSLKPHKNIGLLLESFALLRESDPTLLLVLAGESLLQYPELLNRANSLGIWNAIRELSTLRAVELRLLYNCAEILVMPSQYEGFGLPPLEAMACGTPVVSSRGGSLPEIVGNAAYIVSSFRPEDWAGAIDSIRKDGRTRKTLREKGLHRSGQFSWEECASRTLDVYRKVLGASAT